MCSTAAGRHRQSDEVIGGAAIKVAVESAARGLGRSGGRMRSDSDQRLINATDGYFKNTAYAPEKMLYWGGKRPAASAASWARTASPLSAAARVASFSVTRSADMERDIEALLAFIEERLTVPHAWGRNGNDCMSFVAGAIDAQTGGKASP
jgi:hypothetical protein